MKKNSVGYDKYLRIFVVILIVGLLVMAGICYGSFNQTYKTLKELLEGEYTIADLNNIVDDMQVKLGLFVAYILYVVVTIVLSIKVAYNLYSSNKQGRYSSEINKLISYIDRETDIEGVKSSTQQLINTISDFSKTSHESNQMVLDSLSQIYMIKSMRAEKDFEKINKYTAILMKACVQSMGLSKVYNDKRIEMVAQASTLYDIGKISVPGYILYKDGNLSSKEYEMAKYHAVAGYELLNSFKASSKLGTYENYVRDIAAFHHEKFNGTGYPYKKSGEDIPFIARVVSLVTIYDTVTRDRPYKKAMTHEEAVLLINNEKGTTFDPNIVKLFNAIEGQFKRILETH